MWAVWYLGCMLSGAVYAILALVSALILWATLNPRKNAEIEMGFVAILASLPILGTLLGAIGGAYFAWARPDLAPNGGRSFLSAALFPGAWTLFGILNHVASRRALRQLGHPVMRREEWLRLDEWIFLVLPLSSRWRCAGVRGF